MSLVCENNGRWRTALLRTSAIRRAFNSWNSIGSQRNNVPHTLNSQKENRYCSIRHCSKTAWISIICFYSTVENFASGPPRRLGLEDLRPKFELASSYNSRVFRCITCFLFYHVIARNVICVPVILVVVIKLQQWLRLRVE